jgi:Dolichyl-phosphate-mannose-protein mannosyltransferase
VAKKPTQTVVPPTVTTPSVAPFFDTRWIYGGITVLILAIIWFARIHLLSLPFERDEGAYSYMGELLLDGGKPYIDFYEMKLPGLFYTYAAMVALFGKSVEGMHLGFGLLSMISAIILGLTTRKLFNDVAAMATTVSFAVLSLSKSISGFAAQGEHLVAFFAILGIYATVKAIETNKLWQYFLAGAAFAMGVMVKQSGVFFAVGAGLMMILANIRPLNFLNIAKNTAAMLLGFLTIVAFFLFLMIKNGAYNQMNYFVFEVAQEYVKSLDFDFGMQRLRDSIKATTDGYMAYWWLGGLGMILPWMTSLDLYKKLGISILAIMAFACVVPGLRFYGHYYLLFMVGLAMLIGAAVYSISMIVEEKLEWTFGKTIAAVLFLLPTIWIIANQKDYYFNDSSYKTIREVYGENPFPETKAIAEYIKANSRSNGPIAIFGSEPQIYFETHRKCVSRHSFLAFTSPQNDAAKKWREEFKADVEKAKPEYCVIVVQGFSWLFPDEKSQDLLQYAFKYVNDNQYDMVGVAEIGGGNKPTIIWGDAAKTYKPKTQSFVYVLRSKS